ncbi:MAG: AAA-like domain-containing protein [Caldilineaceae bacterium]
MASSSPSTDFFQAGGTLPANIPSYIMRLADDELFRRVRAGQFCYVLTSRQMGKSSLMIRTRDRLRKEGVQTAIIDLSALGTQVSSSQWYLGLVTRLAGQLNLTVDVEAWWQERAALSVVQRFTDFVLEVVLTPTAGPIVVFVDEIDSTLKLDFTDDFFAAIRNFYNARAGNPIYERITFVLLGVAAPTDLLQNRNLTPFNIGHPVTLSELTRADAQPLAAGLEQRYPGHGDAMLDRIFHWTSGHPYLTQKICAEMVTRADLTGLQNLSGLDQQVDHIVQRLFLDKDAQNEDNLQFVRSNVEASRERRRLLQLYRRVYAEEQVGDDDRSPQQGRLKLIGLVRAADGRLHVRNRIYRTVFNEAWIKQNTPVEWAKILIIGSAVTALIVIALFVYNQYARAEAQYAANAKAFGDPQEQVNVRMYNLERMCSTRRDRARAAFFALDPTEQIRLFEEVSVEVIDWQLPTIANCLWPMPPLLPPHHKEKLEQAIRAKLGKRCKQKETRPPGEECNLPYE